MGAIYARLIHKQVVEGISTGYSTLSDVPTKYQDATRSAYKKLFGVAVPE